jgi:hypothetical protein
VSLKIYFWERLRNIVAPKEQPPRKLSGKRTINLLTLERRLNLTEGVNLSGKKTDGVKVLI